MLTHLKIQNYALIKALDIDFQSGYTSITGETGAGKSILLGAIGLVMGDRGDSSAILNPSQKCVIEAEFSIEKMQLSQAFEARDLDYSNHCTVRREWHPNGKTRSFINDTPVMVAELKWLGNQLLEIHSQHTGLLVTQAEEQLKLLDAFAGTEILLSTYKLALSDVQQLKALLREKRALLAQIQRDSDYHQYLLNELQDFNPVSGEEIDIEQEINLLSQSEQLSYALSKSSALLNGDDGSLLDLTSKIKSELKGFVGLGKDLSEFYERINQVSIEAKELSRDIEGAIHNHESNPQRLDILNQRFSALQQLLKKHGCTEAAELIQKRTSLEATHAGENTLEEEIESLSKSLDAANAKMVQLADELHEQRSQQKDALSQQVIAHLHQLEMPFAQMAIQLEQQEAYTETGNSKITLLFSANKGQTPMPIEKVASGGEISRLNFCLRTIIADLKQLATLIYDEADTGVSGEVASRLGYLMRKQGQRQQILAITHLPQVAASGNQQLFVFKNNEADISETQIRTLDHPGRIQALAEMLSGRNPSEAAKLNAQHLLEVQSA
ncbi:MAG: DNA repair protein RecN [Bacteroidetes bacterium]|nr:DNA repair protein RecN [Bacteroidota bacterium]